MKGHEKAAKDSDLGDYYTLKAVIDGEMKEVNVAVDVYGTLAVGGNIASKISVNKDGIVTKVTAPDAAEINDDGNNDGDFYIVGQAGMITAEAKDGIIEIDGVKYAYAEDVNVYRYDRSAESFGVRTINALKVTAGVNTPENVFAQVDGNVIVNIFYVEA